MVIRELMRMLLWILVFICLAILGLAVLPAAHSQEVFVNSPYDGGWTESARPPCTSPVCPLPRVCVPVQPRGTYPQTPRPQLPPPQNTFVEPKPPELVPVAPAEPKPQEPTPVRDELLNRLHDRLRLVEQAISGSATREDVLADAKKILADEAGKLLANRGPAVVAQVAEKAAPAATSGLTALLLSLGVPGGAAAVVAGGAVWLGTRRLKSQLRSIKSQLDGGSRSGAAGAGGFSPCPAGPRAPYQASDNQSTPSGAGVAASQSAAPAYVEPIIVRQEAQPLPQVVSPSSTYIPVEVNTVEQEALEWALDEHARRYPGAVSSIEAIRSMARQYASGHPRRKTSQPKQAT